MQSTELANFRQEIDKIDEELVGLLSRRFRVTEKIGHLKAAEGLQEIDPEREAMQEQRLSQLAMRHGVNIVLVSNIFRAVVTEVVSNHRAIRQQHQGCQN